MPDAKKTEAAPVLAPASGSSDPVVHALLGERSALQQWNDQQAQQVSAMQKEIEDRRSQIVGLDKQLAALGYS